MVEIYECEGLRDEALIAQDLWEEIEEVKTKLEAVYDVMEAVNIEADVEECESLRYLWAMFHHDMELWKADIGGMLDHPAWDDAGVE